MRFVHWGILAAWLWSMTPALAQPFKAPEAPKPPPPPPANLVAATVNGQEIPELAVYRSLLREDPKNWPNVRKEVVNFLIDNTLVDQYLYQIKIQVEPKDVDARFLEIKADLEKKGKKIEDVIGPLVLTVDDLRKEMSAAMRWDRFVTQQASEKALREFLEKNSNMFDGSQTQARHILMQVKDDLPQVQARAVQLRKSIEDQARAEMAKLPAGSDKQAQNDVLIKAFSTTAVAESTCPSKVRGGDLGWFPRAGSMVEPFARAAFALKPMQMSEPVVTEFGVHLILVVDQRAGKDVKFEDVRPVVQEVYAERLRELIVNTYKEKSKIVINAK